MTTPPAPLVPSLLHCDTGVASFTIPHPDNTQTLITLVPKSFSPSTTTPDLILTLLHSIQSLPRPLPLTLPTPPPPIPPPPATLDDHNDVYWQYTVGPYKLKITSPATEKHMSKAMSVRRVCVVESEGVYREVSLPFVAARPVEELAWVWNVVEGRGEAERVMVRADGFVLLPDFKWDGRDLVGLYLLAIFSDRRLRCIRDLRGDHVQVLREVRDVSLRAIEARYGLGPRKIRAFFHYHPSFYQLHLHLVHVDMVTGEGLLAGRAHMLDDVISNLERNGNHYAEATLTFVVGENEPIAKLFQ